MGKVAPFRGEWQYDRGMRSRIPLFAFLLIASALVLPIAAHAQGIPFFGPIIPDAANKCAAGWGTLVVVFNRLIALLITLAIIFVAPLMVAYSGFLLVIGQGNASEISKAKGILWNTVVGIVIALAGWMIVDAIMAVLYNSTTPVSDGSVLKTWSNIITSGNQPFCLIQEGSLYKLNQASPGITGVNANGTVVSTNGSTSLCSSSNTACSPSVLQAAKFTATQANVMSCIAVTESSGIPATPPYNTTHPGSNSTACGLFQITQTTWNKYASGACSSFSNCMDVTCNTQVAKVLVSSNGYSDWTCANCNSKAAACVQQYGP